MSSNSCVSSAGAPCNHRVYEYHAIISLLIINSSLFSNTSISSEAVSTIELTAPVASDKLLFNNSSSFVSMQYTAALGGQNGKGREGIDGNITGSTGIDQRIKNGTVNGKGSTIKPIEKHSDSKIKT